MCLMPKLCEDFLFQRDKSFSLKQRKRFIQILDSWKLLVSKAFFVRVQIKNSWISNLKIICSENFRKLKFVLRFLLEQANLKHFTVPHNRSLPEVYQRILFYHAKFGPNHFGAVALHRISDCHSINEFKQLYWVSPSKCCPRRCVMHFVMYIVYVHCVCLHTQWTDRLDDAFEPSSNHDRECSPASASMTASQCIINRQKANLAQWSISV